MALRFPSFRRADRPGPTGDDSGQPTLRPSDTPGVADDPYFNSPSPEPSKDGPAPIIAVLIDFNLRWEQGLTPRAEDYLDQLLPADAVELIYREFCLARQAGLAPTPDEYLQRFPEHGEALGNLFRLQAAFGSSFRLAWNEGAALPDAGDEIGPFRLRRELGRGAFARVFLAEEADLENRLVVLKISTRITPEPQLLARAQHDHIIEIQRHALVDDGAFQIITMPFLGGATLAAVLDAARRQGRPPRSGRELLALLDQVAAPEHDRPANLARPVRDVLSRLSYPRALAWLVARLAEALDHAYDRGVAHGDVKPSNVLLAADGTPLLLDFNLAVGWRTTALSAAADGGGTLAYMAPERLQAIADADSTAISEASDRHRADVYALGVGFLECLTGRPPTLIAPTRALSSQQLASAYAESRRHGARTMLRASGTTIAPALRAILGRCLAPDPDQRYDRASQLAEDLDRWRTDRRMRHARDPSVLAGPRRVCRRFRWALVAVGMLAIVGGAFAFTNYRHMREARNRAIDHLNRYWDHPGAGVFRFRRLKVLDQGDPADTALRHLAYFGVDQPGDWRQRDDFRALPPSLREDLEVWLLEQVWRYGRVVEERQHAVEQQFEKVALLGPAVEEKQAVEDARAESRRALAVVAHVAEIAPLGPLQDECRRLRRCLDQPEPAPTDPQRAPPAPPRWMEQYLLGVAAEEHNPNDALASYQAVLRDRPELFWGHYRAAAVAYRLGDYETTVLHLGQCIRQRPGNPALRLQSVGPYYKLNRIDEALDASDKALNLDPENTESYFSRVILESTGKSDNREHVIHQFERHSRRQGESLEQLRVRLLLVRGLEEKANRHEQASPLLESVLELDPDNLDAKQLQVARYSNTRKLDDSSAREFVNRLNEFDLLIKRDPDNLWARYNRANLLVYLGRDSSQARDDLAYILSLRFERSPEHNHLIILSYLRSSWLDLREGRITEAIDTAKKGLAYIDGHPIPIPLRNQVPILRAEAHYAIARASAVAASTDPRQLQVVADHLNQCLNTSFPDDIVSRFQHDDAFDAVRYNLFALLNFHGPNG